MSARTKGIIGLDERGNWRNAGDLNHVYKGKIRLRGLKKPMQMGFVTVAANSLRRGEFSRRLKSRRQERHPPSRIGECRKLSYNESIVANIIGSLPMNPSDEITLKAFVTALHQLDEPLPPNIQAHLNEVGKQIENSQSAIAYLDAIAPQYPSLNDAYRKARSALPTDANERNKGKTDAMPAVPDEPSNELMNRSIAIFQAPNSVEAAKTAIAKDNKGGLQQLFAFFKKSPDN